MAKCLTVDFCDQFGYHLNVVANLDERLDLKGQVEKITNEEANAIEQRIERFLGYYNGNLENKNGTISFVDTTEGYDISAVADQLLHILVANGIIYDANLMAYSNENGNEEPVIPGVEFECDFGKNG